MKFNLKIREEFYNHTKEPIKTPDLLIKLGVDKDTLNWLVATLRKEGSEIWTIFNGSARMVLTKSIAKPKNSTRNSIIALISNDWYSVRELSDLLYRDPSTITNTLKTIPTKLVIKHVKGKGLIKHYTLRK